MGAVRVAPPAAGAGAEGLGAAGLGDIGGLFPDTDAAHAGADSARLLREALRLVEAEGWSVVNVDSTVVAQAPKLAPFKAAMRERIAASDVPLPFRGAAIGMITAGLMSLAFMGFTGLVKI